MMIFATPPPSLTVREAWLCAGPKAGSGAGRDQIPRLAALAQAAGIDFHATPSINELRSRLDQERSLLEQGEPSGLVVIAAGGDGTLALVAGLTPPEVPIIPMPLGTENLLAHHFGFEAQAEHVLATLTHGIDYRMDAGRAGSRLFLVVASAGFDAEVVRAAHLRRRGHIGRFYYAGPIWRALHRYPFPPIEMQWELTAPAELPPSSFAPSDSPPIEPCPVAEEDLADIGKAEGSGGGLEWGSVECRWGMLFNLPRYGGRLSIEPDAVGNDGRLDLIAFRRGSIWSGLRYLHGVTSGRHLRFADVVRQRVTRVLLSSTGRVPYQLDGDYAGHLPVSIECLPGRVRLRLPPTTELAKI